MAGPRRFGEEIICRERKVENGVDGTIGKVHKGVGMARLERYGEEFIGSDRKAG